MTFVAAKASDTVEYDNLSASVRVDLRSGGADKGVNGSDDLQSIENVVGSDFGDLSDRLYSSRKPD